MSHTEKKGGRLDACDRRTEPSFAEWKRVAWEVASDFGACAVKLHSSGCHVTVQGEKRHVSVSVTVCVKLKFQPRKRARMATPWKLAHILASKLASVPGPAACQACRHASRSTYGWMSQRYSDSRPKHKQQEDMFEDDHDMDAVEAHLTSVISEQKRHQKAAKFHIIKRKMNKRGSPERTLSWDAIEQIRYLKQESPEEWTLQRLAEGFSVSTDVISRVLHSTFTPSTARKLKQDSKVLARTGQQCLRDGSTEQPRLPKRAAATATLSYGKSGALTTLSQRALAVREDETGLMPSGGNVVPAQLSAVHKVSPALPESAAEVDMSDEMEEEEEEEGWVILTEEELEHIAQTLKIKPSPVRQEGNEVFDSEGNFLYRI